MTRIITVTSGTGGAGKTRIAVNLAVRLARCGRRVCLLDADGGTAGAAQLLGVAPRYTLGDLLQSGVSLDKVMMRDCRGFDLVPGNPAPGGPGALTDTQLRTLADALSQLDGYDYILVDSSSGDGRGARAFALAGSETILVVTPDPAVLGDAYGLLRQFHEGCSAAYIQIVINKAINQSVGDETYARFKEVAGFYLGQDVPLLGVVCESGDSPDSARLADRLLAENEQAPRLAAPDFARRFLRASGLDSAADQQAVPGDVMPDITEDEVQRQLDSLADQVGDLIMEVETLRAAGSRASAVIDFPQENRKTSPSRCAEICFAVQTSSEEVTVQGESFSIYHMQRSNGDPQRFACHSPDDDIQEPEPQTTSP
ncbi:MAG: P-loop NTPase [Thiogranum sp.]